MTYEGGKQHTQKVRQLVTNGLLPQGMASQRVWRKQGGSDGANLGLHLHTYEIKPKCKKHLAQVGVPTPRFGPFQGHRINPKCRAEYRNQLDLAIFLV